MSKRTTTEEKSQTVGGEPSQTITEKEMLLFCTSLAEQIIEDGGLEKFLQDHPEHAESMLAARKQVENNPDIMTLASELSKVPVEDLQQSHDALEEFCMRLIGEASNDA